MIRYWISMCVVLFFVNLVLVSYAFCETNPQAKTATASSQSSTHSNSHEVNLERLKEIQKEIKTAEKNIATALKELRTLDEKGEIITRYDSIFRNMKLLVTKLVETSHFMNSINELILGYEMDEQRDRANALVLVGLARKRMEDKVERNRAKAMIERYRQRLVREFRRELEHTIIELSQQELARFRKLKENESEKIAENLSTVEGSIKKIAVYTSKYETTRE